MSTFQEIEQSLLTQIDKLEQRLFELQGSIADGSHVPPGVRVLQLRENPLSEWEGLRKVVVDGLKKENEALLARLEILEREKREGFVRKEKEKEKEKDAEVGAVGMPNKGDRKEEGGECTEDVGAEGGGVPKESWERLNHEKTVLEEVVKQRDKRLLRLQQVSTFLYYFLHLFSLYTPFASSMSSLNSLHQSSCMRLTISNRSTQRKDRNSEKQSLLSLDSTLPSTRMVMSALLLNTISEPPSSSNPAHNLNREVVKNPVLGKEVVAV
jgi:hypothetical protein